MYWYLYLRNLLKKEEGQDLGEYALLFGLIAIVVVLAVTAFGGELRNAFGEWSNQVRRWVEP